MRLKQLGIPLAVAVAASACHHAPPAVAVQPQIDSSALERARPDSIARAEEADGGWHGMVLGRVRREGLPLGAAVVVWLPVYRVEPVGANEPQYVLTLPLWASVEFVDRHLHRMT